MRKVFLEDLPRNGNRINWTKSIGHKVQFIYDSIEGWAEIINIFNNNQTIIIKYNNKNYNLCKSGFANGRLSKILDLKKEIKYKFIIGEYIQENTNAFKILDRFYKYEEKNNKYKNIKYYKLKCCSCGNMEIISELNLTKREHICRKCSDGYSYSEKFVYEFLKQLNLKFETQVTFEWSKNIIHNNKKLCGDKRYDFYIPSSPTCIIETHGEQHYKDIKSWGIILKEEQTNDKLKEDIAKENGIKHYIQLDCRYSNLEHIKNSILNSELNDIFNIDNIDWMKCNNYACKNIAKLACDLWNNGLDNAQKIANELDITKTSVIHYLKMFTKIGLCNYNPKVEISKCIRETQTKNKKPIICLENNMVFNSATDCAKMSLEIFGVELNQSKISCVCNNTRNHHKGYHFKYYKDYLNGDNKIPDNPLEIKVICLTTGKIFKTALEAGKEYNIKSHKYILSCCKGKAKHCGKHPITNEPLEWMYYSEYLKQQQDNIIEIA